MMEPCWPPGALRCSWRSCAVKCLTSHAMRAARPQLRVRLLHACATKCVASGGSQAHVPRGPVPGHAGHTAGAAGDCGTRGGGGGLPWQARALPEPALRWCSQAPASPCTLPPSQAPPQATFMPTYERVRAVRALAVAANRKYVACIEDHVDCTEQQVGARTLLPLQLLTARQHAPAGAGTWHNSGRPHATVLGGSRGAAAADGLDGRGGGEGCVQLGADLAALWSPRRGPPARPPMSAGVHLQPGHGEAGAVAAPGQAVHPGHHGSRPVLQVRPWAQRVARTAWGTAWGHLPGVILWLRISRGARPQP